MEAPQLAASFAILNHRRDVLTRSGQDDHADERQFSGGKKDMALEFLSRWPAPHGPSIRADLGAPYTRTE